MSSKPRSFSLIWLMVATILFLSLAFLWPNVPSEAAPALGFTPTSTSTVTPTPTLTVTPTSSLTPPPTPTPRPGAPDLAIAKRGEPPEVSPGEEVAFTIEVTNRGAESAVGVVVTDEVSEYLEILEVTTTQGSVTIDGQKVTVDVGVVGPDFTVEIVIRARVREDAPAPLEMENVALLTSPNGGDRISQTVTIKVPRLLPVTGQLPPPWLTPLLVGILVTLALVGGGLVAKGIRMSRRDATR